MASTPGTITHRTLISGPDHPLDAQVSKTVWNDSLAVASAAPDGTVFVRDRTQPDGWGFLALPPVDLSGVVPITRTINGYALTADLIVTKADLGLANVENSALSTWAGSAAITQVGVLAAGLTVAAPRGSGAVVQVGEGRALGNPIALIDLALNGVGPLTGIYQYAYTETGAGPETGLSAIATITASGHRIRVTIPRQRRGTSQRNLYRTVAGGSVFKLVKGFDGGDQYFQTLWDDTVADGSLGAVAPAVDLSRLYKLTINPTVCFLRSHPDTIPGPADFGILTSDGETGYSIDAYGPSRWRVTGAGTGVCVTSTNATPGFGALFVGQYLGPVADVDLTPINVFVVAPKGNISVTPLTLGDPSVANGTSTALSVVATHGAANTATAQAVAVTVTGAGSAAFSQRAVITTVVPGYTGTAPTYATYAVNGTASAGASVGAFGLANGAAARNVGGQFAALGGTKNLGLFASADGVVDPTTLVFVGGVSGAAAAFSNSTSTNDILIGFDGTTAVFRVKNGGDVDIANLGGTATLAVNAMTGGGNLIIRANGGSSGDIGSTNNIPIRLLTNNVVAVTVSTAGAVTVVGGFGCNTKAAQGSVASGGALPAYVTGAFGLDSPANMQALVAQVVAIRAALVANGIMS